MKKILFAVILLLFVFTQVSYSQIKGEEPEAVEPDSVFIFKSPRPLVTYNPNKSDIKSSLGLDVFISESGFGVGGLYQLYFSPSIIGQLHFSMSGKRNTDEFQEYDWSTNRLQVRNKINRLYRMPFTIGLQKNLFQDKIANNLTPYFTIGGGPMAILSLPYTFNREPNGEFLSWFRSWGEGPEWYVRPVIYAGIGANFGVMPETLFGVNITYKYSPPGDLELSSIANNPITNFGGLFINIRIGKFYY